MKYQTLIGILFMLLSRKKVTAKAIAERYEISVRTVYRYIQEIELANIPLLVDKGANGGYYIAETFRLPAAFFTQNEFITLESVLSAFDNQLKAKTLESIRDKIKCASRVVEQNVSPSNLIIDSSNWFETSSYKDKLAVITKAVEENKVLTICYHDKDGQESVRDIEPHALALKQGLWYVYAFCHIRNDFRLFKIGRIQYATETSLSFEKKPIDKNDLLFNKWFESNEKVLFEFEVDKTIRSDIEEWLGIENVFELKNGKIIASCNLPNNKSLIYEIMKFGGKLKVIKPINIKKEIIKAASDLIKMYN